MLRAMIMNESSVVRHALIELLADELLAVLDEDALCVLANLLAEEIVDGSVLVVGGCYTLNSCVSELDSGEYHLRI